MQFPTPRIQPYVVSSRLYNGYIKGAIRFRQSDRNKVPPWSPNSNKLTCCPQPDN
jgi:hypothetical protein